MTRNLSKTPIEVFGNDAIIQGDGFKSALKQQYCKYIKGTCVKPRKSEPHVKVGICTLGSTVAGDTEVKPIIICPQRLKEETMFETIRQKYLKHWENVKWIQEVNIGVGGSVDYVAVEVDENERVKDFLCVELQAGGTTGSPYPAVEELKQYGCFQHASYNYGINWANEFTKTMMQQAYKKGKIVESWGRKIVFVIQDVAMDYIQKSNDCSKVVLKNDKMPVDFCMFSLEWHEDIREWKLQFNNILSTTIDGINTILGGASEEDYLTEEEFIENIERKGIADLVLRRY
ncbi:MAG: hypothetical protein II970_04495 [Paludibacteraceae bacterium]|nr:hypothetical protein [Paludibacteraceae bacterium]